MKKILGIVVLSLLWGSSVASKIININQTLSLDVPTNYEFIKIEDSNSSSLLYGMGEFFDELDILELEFYIIAPRAAIDVVQELLDGTEAVDLEVFKTILRKAEKKQFNSYQSQMKWFVSELRKLMKKEKVSSISYAIVSKQKIKNIDDEEFIDFIKEIENMNSQINSLTTKVAELELDREEKFKLFLSDKEVEELYQLISLSAIRNNLKVNKLIRGEEEAIRETDSADAKLPVDYYKIYVEYDIEGKFPNYLKLKQEIAELDKLIVFEKEEVKTTESRTIIVSVKISLVRMPAR